MERSEELSTVSAEMTIDVQQAQCKKLENGSKRLLSQIKETAFKSCNTTRKDSQCATSFT